LFGNALCIDPLCCAWTACKAMWPAEHSYDWVFPILAVVV